MGLFSFFKKKKKNEIEKAEAVSVKEAPKAEVKPELDAEPKNAETVEVSEAPAAQADISGENPGRWRQQPPTSVPAAGRRS